QVSGTGLILDLQVNIVATHSYVGDLVFTLTHQDTGTSVVLIDRPGFPTSPFGCERNDIDVILDDAAMVAVEDLCDATGAAIHGTAIPEQPLHVFEGEEISGTWVLSAYDRSSQDVGSVVDWCLLPTVGLPPNLNCPLSVEVSNDPGLCGADVFLSFPANGIPSPTIEYLVKGSPIANPHFFPIGDNTVEVLATNQLGSATCALEVRVEDTEAPAAICRDATIELNEMGTANILPASLDFGSTDNCGIAAIGISRSEFSCEDLGPQEVVLSVTDTSGLVGMCTATFIVVDTIPPTVEFPLLDPIQANQSGMAPIPSLTGLVSATDNCTPPINLVFSQNPVAGTMVGVGTSEITVFATDESGNTGDQSTILMVLKPPTPTPSQTLTATPSTSPTESPTTTETPTMTSTPGKVCEFDIFPPGGDGRIDSKDLLEILKSDPSPETLAEFSGCWLVQ
ncbi:MAG: proprotein convertase P-domain-containing protein, partial [Candidatus Omnitrophica bacterium]|nr:proprotein convertase P-domain-containing protein [Candidatus Omnitrophota bacterium]